MPLLSGENGHRLRPNSTKDEKSTSADETIGDGDAKRHHSHLNHRHHSARVSIGDTRAPSVVSAAASISAQLVWSDYVATSGMLALIFGGCCSNVRPHSSFSMVRPCNDPCLTYCLGLRFGVYHTASSLFGSRDHPHPIPLRHPPQPSLPSLPSYKSSSTPSPPSTDYPLRRLPATHQSLLRH